MGGEEKVAVRIEPALGPFGPITLSGVLGQKSYRAVLVGPSITVPISGRTGPALLYLV